MAEVLAASLPQETKFKNCLMRILIAAFRGSMPAAFVVGMHRAVWH